MTRTLSLRMRIGLAVMLAMLVVLGGRLFHVQGLDPAGHAHEALSNRLHSIELPPARGDILDAQGRLMASSADRFDIVADPRLVGEYTVYDEQLQMQRPVTADEAAVEIATILDLETEDVLEAMTEEDTHYSVITRSVTPEQQRQIMELEVPGVYAEPVSERTYPSGPVGGSIIGFVGSDGPLEGIESAEDEALTGEPGERVYEIGADGVRIPNATYEEIAAEDGQDIRLTIDQDLQWFAQEAIAEKASQYNAQWANATVLDLKTGEIMAMADSESVDPANPGDSDELFRRPLALTQDFEPGSVGKALTFAMALEEGQMQPDDAFTVPDQLTVDGETIQDARPHDTYEMTAAGIFARSYNTGTVMIGNEVPEATRYDYMRKVGLGETLDVGLGIEAESILRPPEEWDPRQPLTTQFGQGYTTSVLHNVQLYQMLANDGVKQPLRIVDSYIDPDGDEHPVETESERVFSSETSQEMLKLMEGVVDYGSAMDAEIEGYRVGGKTGSAETAGEHGGFDGYTQSFIGVAPLEDPQYLVSVTLHRPQGQWGEWEITDTFTEIMSHTLASYDVAPTGADSEAYDGFVGERQDYPW
ncbi:penicillin-binding protein 2 [Nesterenkonia sp. MY13]|uniref:Penicillin-binding protein 2 n=1 Tax=Nesterenkonia sedimenti TaxID=1463632 RepID=A0A7X8TKY6_9MICC|nr:penicillin-binding protein 2 [Nesterenkonia sedimenti]NLS10262.1 penicillin-binding protein 2 [Nesterenkonia sedimenti]